MGKDMTSMYRTEIFTGFWQDNLNERDQL